MATEDIDFSDLEKKHSCSLNKDYSNVLIIDNLPKIDENKQEKLMVVLTKSIFVPAHAKVVPGGLFFPYEDSVSKGYAFFEFETTAQAEAVFQAAHGYKLDKNHMLSAIRFGEFERLVSSEEGYREPETEPFEEREYLRNWLKDSMGRDQFVYVAGNVTSVCWSPTSAGGSIEIVHSRPKWTESTVQWSLRGSFLATLHSAGVMLWGGDSWKRLGRFPHPNVKLASFSNTEAFMVTWSPFDPEKPGEHNLLVWDVRYGKLVRGFVVKHREEDQDADSTNAASDLKNDFVFKSWPVLRFSFDDSYSARVHEQQLHLYDASFALVGRIESRDIKDVVWSPTEHSLVYWTPGTLDTPARVAVMAVPSCQIIRTKNLFNVSGCHIYWHSNSDYLCVQVDRYAKNKKTTFSNLELFRLREKNIPVEVLEAAELLSSVSWEPNGDRLVTMFAKNFKNIISLYNVRASQDGESQMKLLTTFERKQISKIMWSPKGEFLLMVGLDTTSAFLEFWNMNDVSLMATKEHYLATDVEWDSGGRYVFSHVNFRKHSIENSLYLWDFKGDLIFKQNLSRLSCVAWRPRPPTLLGRERQQEIRHNLSSYSKIFDARDAREGSLESMDLLNKRKKLVASWNAFRRGAGADLERRRAVRSGLLAVPEKAAESVIAEEWIEEVISETEVVVS